MTKERLVEGKKYGMMRIGSQWINLGYNHIDTLLFRARFQMDKLLLSHEVDIELRFTDEVLRSELAQTLIAQDGLESN